MGVYIDMDMPKSCLECRLYNDPWCMAKNRNQWKTAYNRPLKGERQNDCPLVPVPPHGDLIDKDATMNEILEQRGEDTACWFAGIVNDMTAIIPSDKAEEGET